MSASISPNAALDADCCARFMTSAKWPEIAVPLRYVVWAEVADGNLEVSLIARKKKKSNLVLVHITGPVAPTEMEAVSEFTNTLMAAAYRGRY